MAVDYYYEIFLLRGTWLYYLARKEMVYAEDYIGTCILDVQFSKF